MLSIENLDFGFNSHKIFENFSLNLNGADPVVFLGPSGCGKTTLLRLIAGLLRPESGKIAPSAGVSEPSVSFVFQDARLLPYMNVMENVTLPIIKIFGRVEAEKRAMFFLRESALDGYAAAYPAELSGGQRQRASIARAWAYPAHIILMDEPFQSLDIPLKIQLIDSVKRLMRAESRFIAAVTHDPREAVYLGRRIIVLGMPPEGGAVKVVFDETFNLPEERSFVSESGILLEKKLISKLQAGAPAALQAGAPAAGAIAAS